MNKYKRYFIELVLVLVVVFGMIAYHRHDRTELSLDTKTGVNSELNNQKYANAETFSIIYPSNSINSNSIYGVAQNIKIIKGYKEVKIQCAKGYTFLGEFPKENNYTRYKCTQMPCDVESVSLDYSFDSRYSTVFFNYSNYENKIVRLSNWLIKTKAVKRYGQIKYEKDTSTTELVCVPTDQLSHWKEYHWYSLF